MKKMPLNGSELNCRPKRPTIEQQQLSLNEANLVVDREFEWKKSQMLWPAGPPQKLKFIKFNSLPKKKWWACHLAAKPFCSKEICCPPNFGCFLIFPSLGRHCGELLSPSTIKFWRVGSRGRWSVFFLFSSLSLYFASDVENLFILLFIEPALMDLLLLLEGGANSFVAPPGGGGSKHKSCDTKRAKFSIFF